MSTNDEDWDEIDWEMEEWHSYDCDCDECRLERDFEECGLLPDHLGGGCTMAGTEYCDFECRIRQMQEDEEEQC